MGSNDDTTVDSAYDRLEKRAERLTNVGTAAGILRWDQEVVMPSGGTPARAKQLSTLSAIEHEILTAEETGTVLDAVRGDNSLTGDQQAVCRELGRRYDRATSVSEALVEEIAETTANAHPIWKAAREDDDFDRFAPTLERLVSLKREYAEQIDPDRDPYAVLFEDYEPYLELDTAERILTRLRDELVPLLDAIEASDVTLETDAFAGSFDDESQEALARDVLDALGYDWDRGRLDTAPHPFSTGTQFDARVTTRFDESDLLGSITSTIHEFGHANYTLGLPTDEYGTPLGESRDLTVHESQSRLWENHVGRSKPFWEYFLPVARAQFAELADVTPRAAYESANRVKPDNVIRTEADELTYHLHIVVRYEIERDLIAGDLDVGEVPSVWNDRYEEVLGVRPDTDADGCLQDIHWSHGSFGYFPTYTLGSVLAAQLYTAAETALGDSDAESNTGTGSSLSTAIANGEFEGLTDWLRANVHQHGKRYTTNELIERATGEEFSADAFLASITEKYGSLYELST